jgi:endo-1,4-beta-xylanase
VVIVHHYKTLLSHPAVEAGTYWGLSDGGWLGAPSGLVRPDGSLKPSFEALRGHGGGGEGGVPA